MMEPIAQVSIPTSSLYLARAEMALADASPPTKFGTPADAFAVIALRSKLLVAGAVVEVLYSYCH